MAIMTRWTLTAENSCGYLRIARSGRESPTRRRARSASSRALPAGEPVRGHGFRDLPADAVDRIEMAERILKDHGDPAAVDLAPFLGRHCQQVPAVEQDFAGADAARRMSMRFMIGREETDLPEPLFAEDREGLSLVEVIADRLHRMDHARRVWNSTERLRTSSRCSAIFARPSFRAPGCVPDRARIRIQLDSRLSDMVVRMNGKARPEG